MAKVVAMLPGGRRKSFSIKQSQLILGRSETVDIPLTQEIKASRKHLRIDLIAGVITVEDLNSSNGTWYEGERITHRQIKDRDILQIGETRLQFLYDDKAKPDPPKGKKKRNLATIDRDYIVHYDRSAGWVPIDEPTPYIELLDGEERGLKIALVGDVIFGRGANCDVILDDKRLSQSHSKFGVLGEDYFVTDMGSTNGTLVNRQRLAAQQPRELAEGDIVEVGETRIVFRIPEELGGRGRAAAQSGSASASADVNLSALARYSIIARSGKMADQRLQLSAKTTFGRDGYNSIQLDDKRAAKFHAEIVLSNGRFVLRDLDSSAPTSVNGKPVRPGKPVPLGHGDVLQLGTSIFSFEEAGADVRLEKRLSEIRNKARAKILTAMTMGLVVLVLSLAIVYDVTDRVIAAVVPEPSEIPEGIESSSPMPELSFEALIDEELSPTLRGWEVRNWGTDIEYLLDAEVVQGGLTSLRLRATAPSPTQRITLFTRQDLSRRLAEMVNRNGAISASVQARMPVPAGFIEMRAIAHGPELPRDGLPLSLGTFDATRLRADTWTRLPGQVSLPATTVDELVLELTMHGEIATIYFDEVRFESSAAEAIQAVELPSPSALSIAMGQRGAIPLVTHQSVALARDTPIPSVQVVALRETQGTRIFARSRDAALTSLQAVRMPGSEGLEATMVLSDPEGRRGLPVEWQTVFDDEQQVYTWRLRLLEAMLAPNEKLGLELDLHSPLGRGRFGLVAYNAEGDEVRPPRGFAGRIDGISELCWATGGGSTEVALRFPEPASILVREIEPGRATVTLLLLSGHERERFESDIEEAAALSATVELRPYSLTRAAGAEALLEQASDLLRGDVSQLGEAVLLLREGLRRYDGLLDFGRSLRDLLERVDAQWRSAYQRAEAAATTLERAEIITPGDASRYVRTVSDGLAACEEFLQSFRAMTTEARRVEMWAQELRRHKRHIDRLLDEADRAEREASAQRLIRMARRHADMQRPNDPLNLERNVRAPHASTVLAMAYLEEVIQSFPDVTEAQSEAILLRDAIRELWEYERRNPELVLEIIDDAREEAEIGERGFEHASMLLRQTLNRWPHSQHRIELLANWHYFSARASIALAEIADEPEEHRRNARRHLEDALAILPEPAVRDPQDRTPLERLYYDVDHALANLGR